MSDGFWESEICKEMQETNKLLKEILEVLKQTTTHQTIKEE